MSKLLGKKPKVARAVTHAAPEATPINVKMLQDAVVKEKEWNERQIAVMSGQVRRRVTCCCCADMWRAVAHGPQYVCLLSMHSRLCMAK